MVTGIGVWGDTMYGVKDGTVHRQPVTIDELWTQVAKGPMRSLAIGDNGDTIYGISIDKAVYKQDLHKLTPNSHWTKVSAGSMNSITIEGDTIYGVGTDQNVWKQKLSTMSLDTGWDQAGGCCNSQITAHDGKIYGIGTDHRIYYQVANRMTHQSHWIEASKGSVQSMAIRGDTIYSVINGTVFDQRLSGMTPDSEWLISSELEDDSGLKYSSIMVHNDIMYACGHDHQVPIRLNLVYRKTIDQAVKYLPNLVARGTTHQQALRWNLTDIVSEYQTVKPPSTTVHIRPHHQVSTSEESREEGPSTGSTTTAKVHQPGVMNAYVDRFQDLPVATHGSKPVTTDHYDEEPPLFQNKAERQGFGRDAAHSIVLALILGTLG